MSDTITITTAEYGRLMATAKAATELTACGDEGVFMTSESGGPEGDRVVLQCRNIDHLQATHRALIAVVKSTRNSS